MRAKNIELPSHWKDSICQELIEQDGDTLVVLLPGNKYTNFGPLFYYAYNLSLQLGYDVLAIEYGFQKTGVDVKAHEIKYVIDECKAMISKCLESNERYKKLIFIGKCTGTGIQIELINEFSNYEQLNVFLTPMARCIDAINQSKSLVIVGTHDGYFLQNHLEQIDHNENVKIRLIENANHDLDVEDFKVSIDILKLVSEAIYSFIAQ